MARRGSNKKRINYKKQAKQKAAQSASKTSSQIKPAQTVNANKPKVKRVQKPVDKAGLVTMSFNATDTLFFRESRPMESMGELQSIFPPSVRTLSGAVRTLIGDQLKVDWQAFAKQKDQHPAAEYIGYGDDLNGLSFNGAWLTWQESEYDDAERLYPAPLHMMKNKIEGGDQKEKAATDTYSLLQLNETGSYCDLGCRVRLPKFSKATPMGSKPLENTWLTKTAYEALLKGSFSKLEDDQLKTIDQLFKRESRLGIARDNTSRTVEEGLLYQTQHIRPYHQLNIALDVKGLPDAMPDSALVRLGGEGRTAHIALKQYDEEVFPAAPKANNQTQGIILYLLTPLKIKQADQTWQPLPGFTCSDDSTDEETKKNKGYFTTWKGLLNEVDLTLCGSVTGKVLREGGWDMAKHQPRAVESLIPQGSVFFCTCTPDQNIDAIQKAIDSLHNTKIGESTEYGYGHIAVGLWNKV